jgi:hypothetical protein
MRETRQLASATHESASIGYALKMADKAYIAHEANPQVIGRYQEGYKCTSQR